MSKDLLIYAILFIVLVLLQVLICNNILLFNVAVPLIFIYFIIHLPISLKLSAVFSLAFFLGLIVDIFSDTPGLNALACTLIAAIRKPVFFAYVPADDHSKNIIPSITSLGVWTFSKYLLTMTGIYCLLVFTIEYFNFADVKDVIILAGSSCLLTFVILMATDCLLINKREKRL